MNKLFYPAVFQTEENNAYTVFFPDIEGCTTCGENMEKAYVMAFDALGLILSYMEDNNETIPAASLPSEVKLEANQFLVLIEFDMQVYKRKHGSRAVKKTLSIPEWLNEEATAMGVNFSQVLQEALIQKIHSS